MSWPQWQPPAQPSMPMLNTAMPLGIQYTAEQWQNWQQWAQWQQQYQQWHQQYGADYQKSLTAMANMGTAAIGSVPPPVINTTAPPPLPNDAKPPPPPDEPTGVPPVIPQGKSTHASNNFPKTHPYAPMTNVQGYNSMSETNKDTTTAGPWQTNLIQPSTKPPSTNQTMQQDYRSNKRPSNVSMELNSDTKKNKMDWQPPPGATQTSGTHLSSQTPVNEKPEELSDPEKKFMKQFAEWEAQFNKWKEQNQDHPDKVQYREYEKKWEAWRNQLLERRDLMRKKRLGIGGPATNELHTNTNAPQPKPATYSIPSGSYDTVHNSNDPAINPINSNALATLFKNNLKDGIPGLDLVDAPAQPDNVSVHEKPKNDIKPETKPPGLNFDALSKNLNSILGDQKLLSMLSLVTQNASIAQKTEILPMPVESKVVPPSIIQNAPPASGITLAPKVPLDDQVSNWSTNTNLSGTSNSTNWNQDASSINTNNSLQGRRLGNVGNANQNYNKGGPNSSFEQSPNSGFGPRDTSFGRNNSYSSNQDYPRDPIYDYNENNESRFMNQNSLMSSQRENSSFDGYGDDYWHPNNGPNLVTNDANLNMAPAPPTITDFDDLLHIDKIFNYDHKPQKQGSIDVKVFSPHIFDYRHKLVTRIPYPDRPKWLNESFHNIPEFSPPIARANVPFSRYPPTYHPGAGPMQGFNRYDSPGPAPSYSRYDDYNTFTRRPPMDFDRSDPLPSYPGPYMEKDMPRSNFGDNYDYSERSAGKWFGRDRDSRERSDRDRNSRGRDFDTRKSRNSRDRERDGSTNINLSKDAKADTFGIGGGNNNGNFDKSFSNVGIKQDQFGKTDSDSNNRGGHCVKTSVDDLLNMPGRAKRPARIVIILRGPPGSGKTFLAKQIKDKEAENGGSAPRILSLDDYFMVEQEREVIEDGKTVKVKDMVYEYEECMEAIYRQSLLKTFKKTITDGYFSFIIVDNVNDKVKYFDEMWSFAKQNGFQVYVCQLELDVQICTKRNTHGRSEVEIQHIVSGWEDLPSHYGILDVTNLLQAGAIPEVEMEEINSPNDDFGDDLDDEMENEEQACNSSKWDNFECSIDNLAKLDGINKPLRSARTMEDYLQLDEWIDERSRVCKPGQKRVRWADLEERKEQEKMRAIGFVVGHTDWGRMMDPSQGSNALTQTKYIERVGVRKVNMN